MDNISPPNDQYQEALAETQDAEGAEQLEGEVGPNQVSAMPERQEPPPKDEHSGRPRETKERRTSDGGRARDKTKADLESYDWDGNEFFAPRSFERLPICMRIWRVENGNEIEDISYYRLDYSKQDLAARGGTGKYVARLCTLTQDGRLSRTFAASQTFTLMQGDRKAWPPKDILNAPELVSFGIVAPDPTDRPTTHTNGQSEGPASQPRFAEKPKTSLSMMLAGQEVIMKDPDQALTALFAFGTALVPKAIEVIDRAAQKFLDRQAARDEKQQTRIEFLENRLMDTLDKIRVHDDKERERWITRLESVETKSHEMLRNVFDQGIEYNKAFSNAIADYASKERAPQQLPEGSNRENLRIEGLLSNIESKIEGKFNGGQQPALSQLNSSFEVVDAVTQRMKAQIAQLADAVPSSPMAGGSEQSILRQWLAPQNMKYFVDNLDKFVDAAHRIITNATNVSSGAPAPRPPAAPRPPVQAPIGTGIGPR